MYISYFELRKILSKLEEEYSNLQKNPRVQTDKKFGFYGAIVTRRISKEVKDHISKKYENNS